MIVSGIMVSSSMDVLDNKFEPPATGFRFLGVTAIISTSESPLPGIGSDAVLLGAGAVEGAGLGDGTAIAVVVVLEVIEEAAQVTEWKALLLCL